MVLNETYETNEIIQNIQNSIINNTNSELNSIMNNKNNNMTIMPDLKTINQVANNIIQTCKNDDSEANLSGEILLMMFLLIVSFALGSYVKKKNIKYFNESLIATVVGLFAGLLLRLFSNKTYINNITNGYVKFFLIVLLPPIIFESGYNLKKAYFFKNFGTILIYAIIGTLFSIFFTGFCVYIASYIEIFGVFTFKESMAFGSLISATDPVCILAAFKDYTVDPNFYQILFGESILNDAVSIVFYETVVRFNDKAAIGGSIVKSGVEFTIILVGSVLLGYFIGFITAWFLKFISFKVKKIQKIEIGLMAILPWVSYLSAELLNLSGIVAILFNGIAHATYTKPNLTSFSLIAVKSIYEGLAHVFETLVFIFVGIGFFQFGNYFK